MTKPYQMKKIIGLYKNLLTYKLFGRVQVWHLCVGFGVIGAFFTEPKPKSSAPKAKTVKETQYHNLGGGFMGGEYTWLEVKPNKTALIYNCKESKSRKPEGLKSCRTEGTWSIVGDKVRVSGFSNNNCSWVSRYNGKEVSIW